LAKFLPACLAFLAKGAAARAVAFAKKARQAGKNLAKKKGMRRALDAALSSDLMTVIPGGHAVSKVYSVAKAVGKAVASPCLKKWFDCLTDPFSERAQGACIPSGNNMSSMRYYAYTRGDIVIGTMGVGYMLICPTTTNDCTVVWATTAAFAGTDCTPLTASGVPTVGVSNTTYLSNARFTAAQLYGTNPAVSARIVGGGVKVYYTGTELNLGGLMSIYTNPTHDTVQQSAGGINMTTNQLGTYQETVIRPISRVPFEYPLAPLLDTELSYPPNSSYAPTTTIAKQDAAYPWSQGQFGYNTFAQVTGTGASTFIGVPTTILMFTGVAGNTIHFELGLHCEAVGDATEGMRMPAESDPVGVDHMMAAMSRLQVERNSRPSVSTASVLKSIYSDVAKMAATRVPL